MKSLLISFNQALREDIIEAFDKLEIKGFTFINEVQGRGSKTGEPHYGSHAWPTLNSCIIVIAEDEKIKAIMPLLRAIDEQNLLLGLRAFVWTIEDSI